MILYFCLELFGADTGAYSRSLDAGIFKEPPNGKEFSHVLLKKPCPLTYTKVVKSLKKLGRCTWLQPEPLCNFALLGQVHALLNISCNY